MRPVLLILTSTYPRWACDPEPGFVHELAKRLTDRFEVHVLCPHAPGALVNDELDGVMVHRYRYAPSSLETLVQNGGIVANLRRRRWKWLLVPLFFAAQVLMAIRLVMDLRPACIHAHWLIPQGVVLAVARGLGVRLPPFALTSHGGDLFGLRGSVPQALKRWVVRKAAAVTVVSRSMLPVLTALGVSPQCVSVIPMGVDLEGRFQPGNGLRPRSFEVLFVGRLVEKKGLRYLLSAMPGILTRYPKAKLTIVGYGPEKDALLSQARALGILQQIELMGPVPQQDLPKLYRRAAVFVAPFVEAADGDQEGLGLVTLEAIGCGCPVIVSRLPGVMDVLDSDQDFDMLVPPADPDRLTERICAVLDNPEMARQRVEQVRSRLVATFGWSTIAERYGILLDSLLESGGRG